MWRIFFLLILQGSVLLANHLHENEIDDYERSPHPINPKSPASELHDEVDILKLMNVSIKDQGISLVEGPIASFPAYKFRLPYGNVPLSNSRTVISAMDGPKGFTAVFVYRQQKNNLGTLMSVHSPGRLTPWFQLIANSRTGILGFKIRLGAALKPKIVEWEMPRHHRKAPLAAWTWLSISIDPSTGIVRLDLDCQPSRFESLTTNKRHSSRLTIPQDSLVYFRQEPGRKKKFLGSMQVAKVLPYVQQERLWTCMEIGSNLAPELRKPIY